MESRQIFSVWSLHATDFVDLHRRAHHRSSAADEPLVGADVMRGVNQIACAHTPRLGRASAMFVFLIAGV